MNAFPDGKVEMPDSRTARYMMKKVWGRFHPSDSSNRNDNNVSGAAERQRNHVTRPPSR